MNLASNAWSLSVSQPKITIVGGGSRMWTPKLGADLLLSEPLQGSELMLYDIDRDLAQQARRMLQQIAQAVGANVRIKATDKQRTALSGADYVLITISTGGFDAMAHDLDIPEQFGIYHTVGDTSGPGGWARTIRNFDAFIDLAQAIARYCPQALVLNYTNPMTTLTDVLCRVLDNPVVGLCHGLFENLRLIQKRYQLQSEDDISIRYGGLNHFFWATQIKAGDTDVMTDLTRQLQTQSFTQWLSEAYQDEAGFGSPNREVATELFRMTGAMPYLGDRHTCEFFPWYITSRKAIRKYKLVRTSIAHRRKMVDGAQKRIDKVIKGDVPAELTTRSRETAADIIAAHLTGQAFIDVGNVPNIGQIASLPAGLVVETPVRVDRNGFTPLCFGALPQAVQNFVEPYAAVYSMTVDACFEADRRLAVQALRADPVCAMLDGEQVEQLADKLLGAHKPFITAF